MTTTPSDKLRYSASSLNKSWGHGYLDLCLEWDSLRTVFCYLSYFFFKHGLVMKLAIISKSLSLLDLLGFYF
jgi:hypothetical protein